MFRFVSEKRYKKLKKDYTDFILSLTKTIDELKEKNAMLQSFSDNQKRIAFQLNEENLKLRGKIDNGKSTRRRCDSEKKHN